ncbi:MerR family transcriptional regulator [Phenylobacterium aquaticum]|uniref:MerR family transcriptional regulator n=1 Tax=Phenylobacterium aquaticum TaxID=1763816 RepID=UPI001F5DCD78|nr:MerR family transcriptional regulator [Phenylobacterium aquaticum]MCI3134215.1 MerR family transcriptional regulator [Phenylobacterium aquaticum]
MGIYTVGEVARLSGLSIRALRHYDEIGLLKPMTVGENGYRYYGADELLRLQQILFHRELGLPLDEIRQVLDAPDFDRVAALKTHRVRLAAEARRYRELVKTLDTTLAALEGDGKMNEKAMYKGFDPKKQAEYEAWVIERYGPGVQWSIDAVKTAQKDWKQADFDRFQAEFADIESNMATSLGDGAPVESEHVQALMRRLHAWVARSWARPPNRVAFANLADLYDQNPDFRARYEAKAEGLTEYLGAAMKHFAEAELE